MTWLHVNMIARLPCFHACLAAMRAWNVDIFALAITMTQLATLVKSTLELLPARLATSWLLKPAWLVLECLLPANAPLLHEKWALGTVLVVCVAVVGNLRVSTWSRSRAVISAFGRSCATRLWRVKHRLSAMTTDIIKDCLRTRWTGPTVTHLLTSMAAAFQLAATDSDADVLGLDLLMARCRVLVLPLCGNALHGLLLRRTAAFAVLMPTAVELSSAYPHTLGRADIALVTKTAGSCPPTPTCDVHSLQTRRTVALMASPIALMAARQEMPAGLLALWNRILAAASRVVEDLA